MISILKKIIYCILVLTLVIPNTVPYLDNVYGANETVTITKTVKQSVESYNNSSGTKDTIFYVGSSPCISFNNKDYQVFEVTVEESGFYSLDIYYGAVSLSYKPKTAILVYDGTDYVEIARAEIEPTGSYEKLDYQNIGNYSFLKGTYKIKVYQPYADIYFSSFSMTKKSDIDVRRSVESYDKNNDKIVTSGVIPYISFNGGDYQIFEFVTEQAGLYKFDLCLGALNHDYRAITSVQIFDGSDYVEVGKKIVDPTGAYATMKNQTIGYYELKAGINKIKIYQRYADIWLSKISLEKMPFDYQKLTKSADDYDSVTATKNEDGTVKFSHSLWATYSFDIETDGQYMVYATASTVQNTNVVSVFYGENELCSKKLIKGFNGVFTEYYIGNINLTQGRQSITLKNTGTMYENFSVSSISLVRIGDACCSVMSGETLFTRADAYDSSTNSESLSVGDYLNYDVVILEEGIYKVSANVISEFGSFGVSVNGKNVGIIDSDDKRVFFFKAESGKVHLKIQILSGNIILDAITFEKISVTEDDLEFFTEQVNISASVSEIEKVIEEKKSILIKDFYDVTEELISLLPVYVRMYSKTYDDASEVVSSFYKYVSDEKENPSVIMLNNGTKTPSLASGNVSIKISCDIFGKNATVMGAIYEGNRLCYIATDDYKDDENELTVTFGNIVINEEKQYNLKLIYLDSLHTVKPYEKFDTVYKEFYVSQTNGNDENDGSQLNPFSSLQYALDYASQYTASMNGDIIINLLEGNHYITENINITNIHSGQNGYNVIIRGAKENKSIINGGKEIKNWIHYQNGIYRAKYEPNKDVRNLYVNDYPAIRAKSEYAFRCSDFLGQSDEYTGVTVKDQYFPKSFERPQDLELVWELVWETQRTPVNEIAYNGDIIELSINTDLIKRNSSTSTTGFGPGKQFYLENALELLDVPGEFYYNSEDGYIYYYPFENEILSECEIYVGASQGLVSINGNSLTDKVHNVSFENIAFKYGIWETVSELGFLGRQADCVQDMTKESGYYIIPAQFLVNYADNISVRDCKFSCLGSGGIAYRNGVSNSEIIGSVFTDISATGIAIGSFEHEASPELSCENIQIKNNVIRRTAIEYRSCTGISLYYDTGVEICHNTICDLPYTAITGGWGWGAKETGRAGSNRVCHNHIENVMCTLSDGGGIYFLGKQKNTVVTENYVNKVNRRNAALYSDNGSAFIHFYKNLCTNMTRFATASPGGYSNYYIGNYVETKYIYEEYLDKTGYEIDSFIVERDSVLVDPENLEGEALEIKNNSGVLSQYEKNIYSTDVPFGKTSIINITPKRTYTNGVIYEAESTYTSMGTHGGKYSSYLGISAPEGIMFEVELENAGVYELGVYSASENSTNPEIEVYIDDELQASGNLSSTATWTTFTNNNIGNLTLQSGKVNIYIKCKKGSFHIDCFTLNYIG